MAANATMVLLASVHGAVVAWLFLGAVRREIARAASAPGRRRPHSPLARALAVAGALFAPALITAVAVLPSMAGFILARNALLVRRP